jgi:hypothetical protein
VVDQGLSQYSRGRVYDSLGRRLEATLANPAELETGKASCLSSFRTLILRLLWPPGGLNKPSSPCETCATTAGAWRPNIFAVFYATMVLAALIMDVAFTALGWVPQPDPNIRAEMVDFRIDYTFWPSCSGRSPPISYT